jgi:hypothetical protein
LFGNVSRLLGIHQDPLKGGLPVAALDFIQRLLADVGEPTAENHRSYYLGLGCYHVGLIFRYGQIWYYTSSKREG